ncbi:MAG: hypothetical protein ACRDKV_09165 [Solirubrobacterales bacterium]
MPAQRVDIGFIGGQVITVRLEDAGLNALRQVLESETGWHDLDTEDGRVALDLAKIVYLRLDSGEHRVGFTTES